MIRNYPELCRSRATNPAYPLDLLRSLRGEFEKGLAGEGISPDYLAEKAAALSRFVDWLSVAEEQRREAAATSGTPSGGRVSGRGAATASPTTRSRSGATR